MKNFIVTFLLYLMLLQCGGIYLHSLQIKINGINVQQSDELR